MPRQDLEALAEVSWALLRIHDALDKNDGFRPLLAAAGADTRDPVAVLTAKRFERLFDFLREIPRETVSDMCSTVQRLQLDDMLAERDSLAES